MVASNPGPSREGIARELMAKAAELWGRERAEEIRAAVEETAAHLWLVAQAPPDPEVEPGFFL